MCFEKLLFECVLGDMVKLAKLVTPLETLFFGYIQTYIRSNVNRM